MYHFKDEDKNRHLAYRMVIQQELTDGIHYYGVQGIKGWSDPPILDNPSETRTIDGREYEIFIDGDRVSLIAWHRGENTYWVSNDLLNTLTNDQMVGMARSAKALMPNAKPKPGKAKAGLMAGEREPIGVIGVGWVGLVTAACFAELGHPVIARDIVAEKVEALSRGEVTIHEPGLGELLARNAERLTFTTEMDELLDAREPALRLRRHAADALRRRRPLAGPLGRRGARRRRGPRADHEEHGAGRDRRRDQARARLRRLLRLLPGVPQGGLGGRRTSCIPTGSWSAPTPATRRPATASRRCTSRSAASWSAPTSPAPR